MAVTITNKTCSACKKDLPTKSFCADKSRLGGLRHRCRQCEAVTYSVAQASKSPEVLEQWRAKRKAYIAANTAKIAEHRKAWKAANSDKIATQKKVWEAANADKMRASSANKAAKRRAWTNSGMTSRELGEWSKAQAKTCHWCDLDCADNFHIDHYFPLSKGGSHTPDNLVIACPTCNMRKGAKDPEVFRLQLKQAA